MSKNLIIVESPAKAKTSPSTWARSSAHWPSPTDMCVICCRRKGAVDPEHDFAMKYVLIEKNKKHVDAIVKAMKKADCPVPRD